jgi:DsbC/DsbD-like thiol-disulfide interchange protein
MRTLRSKISLALLCSIAVILTACAAAKQTAPTSTRKDSIVASANETAVEPSTSTQKVSPSEAVKVRASEITAQAGGESAEAVVEIVVAHGFHINTNPASNNYLIATELKIEPMSGVTLGKFVYPAGKMQKFIFAEEPISVYEGTIPVTFTIRADKTIEAGQIVLRGKVRAQPCNESACFPSRTVEFSLPIQITR